MSTRFVYHQMCHKSYAVHAFPHLFLHATCSSACTYLCIWIPNHDYVWYLVITKIYQQNLNFDNNWVTWTATLCENVQTLSFYNYVENEYIKKVCNANCCNVVTIKVKWSCYRPGVAQRVGRGIALPFHDCGTGRWSAAQPRHTLPWETPGTHFTGGWVGPRTSLDGRKILSRQDLIPDRPASSQSELPGPYCSNHQTLKWITWSPQGCEWAGSHQSGQTDTWTFSASENLPW